MVAAFVQGTIGDKGDVAHASSGSARPNPAVMGAPWNANSFTTDIVVENVVTTTQCATNPNDPQSPTVPCGLGSYEITVSWDSTKLQYVNIIDAGLLSSTGRTAQCPVKSNTASTATLQCVSLGATPAGPQGNGVLARIQLKPLVPSAGPPTTPLSIDSLAVADIQGQPFPMTTANGEIKFDPCYADVATPTTSYNFNDVFAVLDHFGESPPPTPGHDPSGDNKVTFLDVFYHLRLFGVQCTPP
jgi:hypothetical protein